MSAPVITADSDAFADAVDRLDWPRIRADIHARGFATTGPILDAKDCRELSALYDDDALFRSRVVMARHSFGRGEYKYLNYALPEAVQEMRAAFYPRLVPVANQWQEMTGAAVRFPPDHGAFLRRCHNAGQKLPTPLLLRYETDDYNCLHQDLYGEHVFPLQVAVLLSDPAADFTGGEFVPDRTAPAHAVKGGGGVAGAGRGGYFRGQRAPRRRQSRCLQGAHAARRQPGQVGPAGMCSA